jgi:hypothetical protein
VGSFQFIMPLVSRPTSAGCRHGRQRLRQGQCRRAPCGAVGTVLHRGDSLHPKANVEKMVAGIPLQDDDRWPSLGQIGAAISAAAQEGGAPSLPARRSRRPIATGCARRLGAGFCS